jgi:uncharacterized membrane protein
MLIKRMRKILKKWESFLTLTLVLGIIFISLGIYWVGKGFKNANLILIFGSFLVYFSLIAIAIKA